MRIVWFSLGSLSLALGMIGAILPLLPTVPFLLLATFCFARSSPRLHNWLITHPVYGAHIVAWQERGAIQLRAKRLATGMIALAFLLAVVFGAPAKALILQVVILGLVLAFIWSRPSR